MKFRAFVTPHTVGQDALTSSRRICARDRVWSAAAVCLLLAMGGCRPAPLKFPASLNSPYPDERVRAARTAVDYPYTDERDRRTAIELLVGRLDDDDEAVRFFSIIALEKMTGTRRGYEYHAPLHERLRAVEVWRRYLEQESARAGKDATFGPKLKQVANTRPSENGARQR